MTESTLQGTAELFGTRLIVWDSKEGLGIYRSGFFGKPVGIPKPKPDQDFDVLLRTAKGTYRGFTQAYQVYKDLRNKAYIVTPGIKFGADFAVYEHGPGIDHAPFIVSVETPQSVMGPFEVVRAGRLATTVRKQFILAIPEKNSEKIRYLVFSWFKA